MKTKILKVKITFLEPVLGTWPSNQNVARDFHSIQTCPCGYRKFR